MKPSISETELLRLSDQNLLEFWCSSSKWIPQTEISHEKDTVLINSSMDFPGCSLAFNQSLNSDESPESFITRTKKFFKEKKPAFSIQLRGHSDQSLIRYCKENNIYLVSESPGMVLDQSIKESEIPNGAELKWVDDQEKLNDFRQVVTEAYKDLSFPVEVSEGYFTYANRVIRPQFNLAVVYFEGEPACTAMSMLSHEIAGIYWVGTTKKARGKGLADYCTREVSNAAFALGAKKVVLQASKYGESIYLKMGYRELTRYPWFICSST